MKKQLMPSHEVLDQASGYWLFATNDESTLVNIEVECKPLSALIIAKRMIAEGKSIAERVLLED